MMTCHMFGKITLTKQREVMSIIDRFFEETPHGESPWTKQFFCLSFILFTFTKLPR